MDHAPARQVDSGDVAAAALALHAPDLGADAITALLESLVVELGLADEAVFVPAGLDWADATRDPAAALVPVRRPGGAVDGVLRCRPGGEEALRLVEMLAAHAAVALAGLARLREVARREEAMRRVAEQLQDSLLPPLPELPGTTMAVRYRAAAREARVGGDFYDAFPLPDGQVLLVVGDVVGKGIEAAGRTSRITQTLRALALQGLSLDALLERCDEQVLFQDPEMLATVWCGRYSPGTGELEFASLGHPPALLLRAEQDAVTLELEGLPLGMRDLAVHAPELRRRRLDPRDLLVLYTDGVVEASGDFIAGQHALLDAIARRRDDPLADMVAGALDELLSEAGHRDDALMLILRRR